MAAAGGGGNGNAGNNHGNAVNDVQQFNGPVVDRSCSYLDFRTR